MTDKTSPWMPIETAPKDGTRIMLAVFPVRGKPAGRPDADYYHLATWDGEGSHPYIPNDWTHWAPLPPAPGATPAPVSGGVEAAGVPQQKPVEQCRPHGLKYDLPPITMTGAMLLEALQFVAPDRDPEQLETEVRLALRDEGEDIDGEIRPRGLYCWFAEYPEEGSLLIDGKGALVAEALAALSAPAPKLLESKQDHFSIESAVANLNGLAALAAPKQDAVPLTETPVKLQDIEQYRQQIAGICVAAHGGWKEGDGVHPDYETPALHDVAKLYAKYIAAAETERGVLLSWAADQWIREVKNRPLVNIHRRSLDDAWRQVMRYAGGDPDELVGPSHDALLAANPLPPRKSDYERGHEDGIAIGRAHADLVNQGKQQP